MLQTAAACQQSRVQMLPPSYPGLSRRSPSSQYIVGHSRAPALLAAKKQSQALDSLDLEIAVPEEQRPVNELAALKQAWLYSW